MTERTEAPAYTSYLTCACVCVCVQGDCITPEHVFETLEEDLEVSHTCVCVCVCVCVRVRETAHALLCLATAPSTYADSAPSRQSPLPSFACVYVRACVCIHIHRWLTVCCG